MKFKSLKYYSILLLLIWICFQNNALARVINPDSLLLKVKEKLEVIKDYKADIVISLDVDFIKMPDKNAKMYFKYPDKVRFTSDEFFMLPKNGFGMSVQKILKNDYLAVYSGIEEIDNHPHYVIKIILKLPSFVFHLENIPAFLYFCRLYHRLFLIHSFQ